MAQQQNIQHPFQEWYSIKCFRKLIKLYTNCSYLLSKPAPQVFFTGSSILSNVILLILILIMHFLWKLPILSQELVFMGLISFSLQALTQSIGLKNYFSKSQPHFLLVIFFIGSCISCILSVLIIFMQLLKVSEKLYAFTIIIFLLFNTVLLYYTLWQILCLGVLLGMGIEAVFKLCTGQTLTIPYNRNIKLPFLFYPRAPGKKFIEEEVAPLYYSKELHGEVVECILCLIDFKEHDLITVLDCHKNHQFHRDCLRQWKVKSFTCPFCRTPIKEGIKNE